MNQKNTEANETMMAALLDVLTQTPLEKVSERDVEHLAQRYQIEKQDVRSLSDLLNRLNNYLSPQAPSDAFMRSLKADLVGQQHGVLVRMRGLPSRVQVAAGLAAVFAGFMWIVRRRMRLTLSAPEGTPVLQQ